MKLKPSGEYVQPYGVGFLIIYYAFQKNKYTAEEFLVFLMAIIATILAAKRKKQYFNEPRIRKCKKNY